MKNKPVKKKKRKPRIMLGIIEIAGDLWEYRNALRKLDVQADTVVFQKDPFYDLPYDKYYPIKRNKLSGFLKSIPITLKLIFQYDIFFFIFGQSFFPRNLDIYLLKFLRKKVVVFFCGCDIRCREEVLKENRLYSVCQECDKKCDSKSKRKFARFWEKHADLIFSHPEQSQLLKKPYHLTRLAFDLDYWKPFKSDYPRDANKVYIIHAPTDRKLKGTGYIIDAINKLKKEGYAIELILLEGCSIEEVKKWLNVSDIAIDQLISGCYGKFASEAMAMAKPTICYIDEKIKAQVNYRIDPPIVNSSPVTIYQDLKRLIDNPDLRRDIGLKSRTYMEAIHSVEVAGAELKKILESLY
jgi:glycosyltransferase involved in cell wall biosynthesis